MAICSSTPRTENCSKYRKKKKKPVSVMNKFRQRLGYHGSSAHHPLCSYGKLNRWYKDQGNIWIQIWTLTLQVGKL